MTFKDLIDAPELLRAVEDMGWTEPTPIQQKAIPIAKRGGDVVGIARTGTGKTGAFLLPTLEKQLTGEGLRTLALCPTRELAMQVAEDAKELSQHTELFSGVVVGGMPMKPQIRDLRAGYDVLVATPGRLIDHIERGNVDLSGIEVLILDEADRMLDMGFRPQIESILRHVPKQRQTLFFSATMPNGVHALAMRIMDDPEWIEVTPPATVAENVKQAIYSVKEEKKPALLIHLVQQEHWDQVLVFTARKSGADVLISQLQRAGISAEVMHGDKDMKQRNKALQRFAEGDVQVLVATDVAQRGLDVEGISHVVNYDVPRQADDYVHRIGRTARAGRKGVAVTFSSSAVDMGLIRDIDRAVGYRIERISLEGYDYDSAFMESPVDDRPKPKTGRGGGRMGSRSAEDLTPEQLAELLKVG